MALVVRVPASTSNLGAGFDCVGLALDLWLEARLLDGAGPASYQGTLASLDPRSDLIAGMLERRGALRDRRLELRSDIPVGRGLGSSAAALVAAGALVQLAAGQALDRDAVFREAAASEGHPDNAGPAVYGGLFLGSDPPACPPLAPGLAVALAVPDATIDTKTARARLPAQLPRATAIGQAARAASLLLGLAQGDGRLIAFGMEDLVAVPVRRALIPGFDEAVTAGRTAGAFGVTISGAGSAVLAVAPAECAAAVAGAMAHALTQGGNRATAMVPAIARTGLTATRT